MNKKKLVNKTTHIISSMDWNIFDGIQECIDFIEPIIQNKFYISKQEDKNNLIKDLKKKKYITWLDYIAACKETNIQPKIRMKGESPCIEDFMEQCVWKGYLIMKGYK